jgi:hypothetical protein
MGPERYGWPGFDVLEDFLGRKSPLGFSHFRLFCSSRLNRRIQVESRLFRDSQLSFDIRAATFIMAIDINSYDKLTMTKKGRKPKGQFSGKLSNFSTRIQPDTRKALEREAADTGLSISQLAERLLLDGLAARRERKNHRAIRALCFLITQAAQQSAGMHHQSGAHEEIWRRDPFFYRAFKIAVSRILDALDPPGEIKSPALTLDSPGPEDEFLKDWVESFKSPEARGKHAADYVLTSLAQIPRWSPEEREEQIKSFREWGAPQSMTDEFYGMPDAARDLTIAGRGKMPIEGLAHVRLLKKANAND